MTAYRIGPLVREDAPLLSPETPIRRAAAVLVDSRSAAGPVVGPDGRLLGILSQKDCFRTVLHAVYNREWTGRVAEHMCTDVVTINVEEEVIRAAEMFLAHPHRVFPALRDGAITGLLYRSDLLAFLMRHG